MSVFLVPDLARSLTAKAEADERAKLQMHFVQQAAACLGDLRGTSAQFFCVRFNLARDEMRSRPIKPELDQSARSFDPENVRHV